jgi:hypothetical protein
MRGLSTRKLESDDLKESTITYLFARELDRHGISFVLEKILPTGIKTGRGRRARVDLAYFDSEGNLKGIVEFKGAKTGFKTDYERLRNWSQTRQACKYSSFGVPVHYVMSRESFHKALDLILTQLDG